MTQHERAKKLRSEFFADKTCLICEGTKDLRLHHIDPKTKVGRTANIWGLSEKRRIAEIKKCKVICHGCHSRFHKTKEIQHGTPYSYGIRGCRCELCKAAAVKHVQEWRRRKSIQL